MVWTRGCSHRVPCSVEVRSSCPDRQGGKKEVAIQSMSVHLYGVFAGCVLFYDMFKSDACAKDNKFIIELLQCRMHFEIG